MNVFFLLEITPLFLAQQWAICMKLSHGKKSSLLDGKPRTEKSHLAGGNRFVLEAVAFFCHPAWWILCHVTVSCKESIYTGSFTYKVISFSFQANKIGSFEVDCFFPLQSNQ